MHSHEIDYKIIGNDIQLVEIELDPNETVIAEAGVMMYMTEGIRFETKMGDGSEPEKGFFGKLVQAGSRLIAGEGIFITHFTNGGSGKQQVAFAAPYPGTIYPVNLSDHNNRIIAQKHAFLCAALGTKLSITYNRKLGAGFFGGEGFIMELLQGDGMAFLHACGTIVKRDLKNEVLRVDAGCIVAFEEGIDFDITQSGNLKTMMFGGEGLFLATLRGTGKVWLQSLPINKLISRLTPTSMGSVKGREGGGLLSSLLQD